MTVISTKYPTETDAYRIMPLRHNWANAYTFSMEFKTDIITSYNGKEQRRAVRDYARMSVTLSANMTVEEKRQFEYMATLSGNRPVYVGLEMLAVYTREWMNPEEVHVNIRPHKLGDPPFWMENGMTVLVTASQEPGTRETRTLSGFGNTYVEFQEDTSLAEFDRRSQVMPAYLAFLDDTASVTHLTSAAGQASLTFKFLAQEFYEIVDIGTPEYLGALELFPWRPDWSNGIGVDHVWAKSAVDYGFGVFDYVREIDHPTRVMKFNMTALSIIRAYELMAFFQRHRGMANEFFLPTWEDDIPFSSLSGGGLSILIDGTAFGYAYRDSTIFRRIMIRYRDGSLGFHVVEYVRPLVDTDSSVVRVTEPLPVTELTPQNVIGISWVVVARFATDRLDAQFISSEGVQMTMPMQTLENFEL